MKYEEPNSEVILFDNGNVFVKMSVEQAGDGEVVDDDEGGW